MRNDMENITEEGRGAIGDGEKRLRRTGKANVGICRWKYSIYRVKMLSNGIMVW